MLDLLRMLIVVQCSLGAIQIYEESSFFRNQLTFGQLTNRTKRQFSEAEIGKCILPVQPDHGQYTVAGVENPVPGQQLPSTSLNYTCNLGYDIQGESNPFCFMGIWSNVQPKCLRFCKLKRHQSVEYWCLQEQGEATKCKEKEPIGSVVMPRCRTPYYSYPGTLSAMQCHDGSWNYTATCIPECGIVPPNATLLVAGGRFVEQGELPWHAGIYSKLDDPYKQICGGSLVSPYVVISAAHCFWSDVNKLLPAKNYGVALGKIYRPWNDKNDYYAQKYPVYDIKITDGFNGVSANFQEDIALVFLEIQVSYNTLIRPICLNFDFEFNKYQLQHGNLGKVAGWGLTSSNGVESPILKVVELPYVEKNVCQRDSPTEFREYITSDKICAGYKNGTGLCKGDSGGGLVFPVEDEGTLRYYLRGIVSAAPRAKDNECNTDVYISFTEVTSHVEFIKLYVKDLKEHLRSCRLDPHHSIEYRCVRNNDLQETRICTEREPSETLVFPVCSKGYYYPGTKNGKPKTMKCNKGSWDVIVKCVPECGILPEETELAANKRGMPWHVKIFQKQSTEYVLWCGGSLITSTVTISAAHCFWNLWKDEFYPFDNYALAVGNTYSMWDAPQDNEAQRADVANVVPSDFNGIKSNFEQDIALVYVATPFAFSKNVMPICLNFESDVSQTLLHFGNLGKVMTWGRLEDNTEFRNHEVTELSYIDSRNCLEAVLSFLKPYLSGKFCAEYKNRQTDLCYVGGGTGIAFPDHRRQTTTRHYLGGVAFVATDYGDFCEKKAALSFTPIELKHQSFIERNTHLRYDF